ncbi:MAG: hypothetical protein ACYC3X_21525 [Pirellulaceae bacterium]
MIRPGSPKSLLAIGFLTVTRDVEQGLFGGYLVLNFLGRPLEFHCTAPVRPNRAQEILYGPTLDPYLVGERIGQTLLEKSKAAPQIVVTDCPAAMVARCFAATPMVLVLGPSDAESSEEVASGTPSAETPTDVVTDAADREVLRRGGAPLRPFVLGGYRLAVHAEHVADQSHFSEHWPHFAEQIELDEPFGRIREAIDEARASAR